jgi:hypothetical protein
VTLRLAEDYPYYKELLDRHGIRITRRLVIEELEEIQNSGYRPSVIRRVLETRAAGEERQQRPTARLRHALEDLDRVLDSI